MNPLLVAVAAVLVALVMSGIAGFTTWRWLAGRRDNRAMRRRLNTYRVRAGQLDRLNKLLDGEA